MDRSTMERLATIAARRKAGAQPAAEQPAQSPEERRCELARGAPFAPSERLVAIEAPVALALAWRQGVPSSIVFREVERPGIVSGLQQLLAAASGSDGGGA